MGLGGKMNDNLKNYVRGWIVGDFDPSVLKTKELDFGVMYYDVGEEHPPHYHKICTEYIVIVGGKHRIGNKDYIKGDICIIKPYEKTGYKCLRSGSLAVVKVPSGKGDKYV